MMFDNPLLFVASLVVVLACCVYLILARCYNSGLFGALGLSIIAFAAYCYLDNSFYEPDIELLPQTVWTYVGLSMFFIQHVTRVIRSAVTKKRMRSGVLP